MRYRLRYVTPAPYAVLMGTGTLSAFEVPATLKRLMDEGCIIVELIEWDETEDRKNG